MSRVGEFLRRYSKSDADFEALRLLVPAYGVDQEGIRRFSASFLEWEASHGDEKLALQTLRILAGHRHPDGTVIRLTDQAFQDALRLMVENVGGSVSERRELLTSMFSTAATESSAARTPEVVEAPDPVAMQGLARLTADLERLAAQSPQLFERKGPDQAEAREWLTTNGNPHALALNKFWQGNAQSLAFVSALYEAGAVKVVADNIQYEDAEREGGSRSDTLIVTLPQQPDLRELVFELCNEYCVGPDDTGGKFVDDSDQPVITLWWD